MKINNYFASSKLAIRNELRLLFGKHMKVIFNRKALKLETGELITNVTNNFLTKKTV